MARSDVQIPVNGALLSAWWYRPDLTAPCPAIAMAHGFAAVKEMGLDRFADRFVRAGFAVVVFDHRGFGGSSGEPRQEADPVQQTRDYRDVITWLCARPEVDRQRIGIWGTSYSGGHVLQVAAMDRRVRCVVSQVPTISGYTQMQRRVPPGRIQATHDLYAEERDRLAAGLAPRLRAVIPPADASPSVYDSAEAIDFYGGWGKRAPNWRNEVTLSTLAMSAEYEPGALIERISPTPLLMVIADQDTVTPTDLALAAYSRAQEPKSLLLLNGDHFVPYEKSFEPASTAAVEWFARHLHPAPPGHGEPDPHLTP